MLPNYGVTIGSFVSSSHEQGSWLQEIIQLNANGQTYQCNVDVNEATQAFQYMIINTLNTKYFQTVPSLPDGYTKLANNSTSGAIDYIRNPLVSLPIGCLSIFYGLINAITGTNNQAWNTVTGDEAGQALVQLINSSSVFLFLGNRIQTLFHIRERTTYIATREIL